MAIREKELQQRVINNFLYIVMIFFLIWLTLISSCQPTKDSEQGKVEGPGEGRGEYKEYLMDSLDAADRLIELGKKVVQLLGPPRGEGLLSEYNGKIVELYRSEVSMLISNINKEVAAANQFYEKYKERPESKFCSHWMIHCTFISLEGIDKTISDYGDERRWSKIGMQLGTFVYRVEQLVGVLENNTWLSTQEDLAKKKGDLEKELVRLKEERARLLEEKFRKK